jgi:hypothetical protein
MDCQISPADSLERASEVPVATARSVSSDGRSRFWASLSTGSLVAVAPCFRDAAGTAPGDCRAIAGDRDRGQASARLATPVKRTRACGPDGVEAGTTLLRRTRTDSELGSAFHGASVGPLRGSGAR